MLLQKSCNYINHLNNSVFDYTSAVESSYVIHVTHINTSPRVIHTHIYIYIYTACVCVRERSAKLTLSPTGDCVGLHSAVITERTSSH